jgi:hypothetical protein
MSSTTNFLSYKKKKAIQEQLSSQGWNSVIFNPDNIKHTIYFYDLVSGHLQISSLTNSREISADDIVELTNDRDSILNSIDHICTLINNSGKTHQEAVTELSDLAFAYMLTTQSYQVAISKFKNIQNFSSIIVRFEGVDGVFWTRPILVPNNKPQTPNQIKAIAFQILQMDKKNHPERFNKPAKVVKLRP